MKTDKAYVIDRLKELLNIPSPTGNTKAAVTYVKEAFDKLGVQTRLTNKGALIATIEGKNTKEHRVLSAHVDTLGAMVKEVKGNGRLKLTQLGGYAWNSVEGEYCTIHTADGKEYTGTILLTKASSHVHGSALTETKRSSDSMEVRIDAVVNSAEDVQTLGIEVGDFVSFDPRVQHTATGYVKSRHLDDKACVAALLGMAKAVIDEGHTPANTTHFFISNYEEVGHGSAASIPAETTEFIAVDMAAPGDGQTSHEEKVTICAKDSSGPYDLGIRNKLIALAKNNELDYAIDIYPYYGSDASAALRAGWEIRAGLIGPGVDASHSFERTHEKGLMATVDLGLAYILAE